MAAGTAPSVAILVGTSGWQYRHWRPGFYAGIPGRSWLAHYAENFATVELNGSFYRLPDRSRFEAWAAQLPDDFVMAVKMSRYLTHVRRLRDPAQAVERFLGAATGLGDHLGPVLIQLPPTMSADPEALDATLACFPASVRVAVEPRHDSWWVPETRTVLERRGAALVEADRRGPTTPGWRTTPWRYLRFHVGRARPEPCYGRQALDSWAQRLVGTEEAYVYFNNDPRGCAVRDARLFADAIGRRGLRTTRVPPPSLTPVGAG